MRRTCKQSHPVAVEPLKFFRAYLTLAADASMLFAIAIGYIWFGELPTFVMLVGATLVIGAGVLVIWREHQLGLERGKARSVSDPKA